MTWCTVSIKQPWANVIVEFLKNKKKIQLEWYHCFIKLSETLYQIGMPPNSSYPVRHRSSVCHYDFLRLYQFPSIPCAALRDLWHTVIRCTHLTLTIIYCFSCSWLTSYMANAIRDEDVSKPSSRNVLQWPTMVPRHIGSFSFCLFSINHWIKSEFSLPSLQPSLSFSKRNFNILLIIVFSHIVTPDGM